MRYLVITQKRTDPSDFTVCADVRSKDLAGKLTDYWNTVSQDCFCETHPIMEDGDAAEFLANNKDAYKKAKERNIANGWFGSQTSKSSSR